jgi:hypothetical protein
MFYLLSILIFACAVSIKGGWLNRISIYDKLERAINDTYKNNLLFIKSGKQFGLNPTRYYFTLPFLAVARWLIDGSVISVFLVTWFVSHTTSDLSLAALCGLFWMLIWSSMGEEAGAAGDYKGAWGDYMDAKKPTGEMYFSRSYGVKKGIQYGCFFGAGISMALGSWCFWIASATFPLCYFLGSSIGLYLTGRRGWAFAEPIYGAALGLGYALSLDGFLLIW